MPSKKSVSVRNVSGTSKPRFVISNLSGKYVAAGGTTAKTCQVHSCNNSATATAHVRKSGNGPMYLTKTCAHHNSHTNNANMNVSRTSLVKLTKVRK